MHVLIEILLASVNRMSSNAPQIVFNRKVKKKLDLSLG